ncbi:hypothetical protein AB2B41_20860 [Marimonas sp. MJW-29]|uniref:Dynamin family protein n=1 Tax=Sulfitobacter sediminis TaxID=3234186 RepID=A0ABV3RT65_9RHOB
MTAVHKEDPIAGTLKLALDQDLLPAHLVEGVRQLFARLQQPVRTIITGAAQSGKSTLCNLFLGEEIIPATDKVPTIEVAFGEECAIQIEGHDGSSTRRPGLLRDIDIPDMTARIRQELPFPILVEQSFAIVTLNPGSAACEKLSSISDQADVVLWCADTFGDAERQLWKSVPQHLKDHSFLVWTGADAKSQCEALGSLTSELKSFAAEEFYAVYPVALRQDLAAFTKDAQNSASLQIGSDGRQLIAAVSGLVARGRSEDRDQAMALISMFGPDTSIENLLTASKGGQFRQHDAIQTAPKKATEQPVEENARRIGSEFARAIEIINAGGTRLSEHMYQDEANTEEVLSICTDALTNLTRHFCTPEVQNACVREVANDLKQGQEMLQRLKLEKTEDAATDAVAMLYQLKMEFLERSKQLQ